MARLTPVFRALAVAVWRDQRSFGSLFSNNFFLFTLYFLRQSAAFVYLLLLLILFFPLSADALRKAPRVRLDLWPLSTLQRRTLRLLSPWLNPVTWMLTGVVLAAILMNTVTFGLAGAVAGVSGTAFAISLLPFTGWHALLGRIPAVPGPLGQLIRKDIRQMLSTLDVYAALALALATGIYQMVSRDLPPEALMALTLLIVLALSSYAQCLFGLDGPEGLLRYRLLPLRGWQILLAKDAGLVAIAVLVTLPLAPVAGLAAVLAVAAIGNAASVARPVSQSRWRFSSGGGILNGLLQVLAMTAAGVNAFRFGPVVLIPCILLALISLWWYGRAIECDRDRKLPGWSRIFVA